MPKEMQPINVDFGYYSRLYDQVTYRATVRLTCPTDLVEVIEAEERCKVRLREWMPNCKLSSEIRTHNNLIVVEVLGDVKEEKQ